MQRKNTNDESFSLSQLLLGEVHKHSQGQKQGEDSIENTWQSIEGLIIGQDLGLDPTDFIKGSGQEIKAAEDAIDFEDIDELADEEEVSEKFESATSKVKSAEEEDKQIDEDEQWLQSLAMHDFIQGNVEFDKDAFNKIFGSTKLEFLQSIQDSLTEEERKKRELYLEGFQSGKKLRFLRLFPTKEAFLTLPKRKSFRPLIPSRLVLETAPDEKNMYNSRNSMPPKDDQKTVKITKKDIETMRSKDVVVEKKRKRDEAFLDEKVLPDLELAANWNYEIMEDVKPITLNTNFKNLQPKDWLIAQQESNKKLYEPNNNLVPVLDMNDEHLLLYTLGSKQAIKQEVYSKYPVNMKFNWSNDNSYKILRTQKYSNIRQSLSNLQIEHAGFAIRLQSPYFKTRLSKNECRNFHRPAFRCRLDHTVRFSRLIRTQNLQQISKNTTELLKSTVNVSLGDTSSYVLLEYSEEKPLILNNVGMGSRIVNYYRRKDASDNFRPKLKFGESRILELQDQSVFWNFGSIEQGETTPTLYNNLVRAPVFRHEPKNTDFLVIKSSLAGTTRYYLRNIKHLYLVGQLFPAIDIPGPHSRRVTATSKNRLKMVVFRMLHKHGNVGLSIKEILRHFSDQNEMQIRQRLKEFMEYQKKGTEDYGLWKLRTTEKFLDEQATRELISPEMVCLLDSMQAGVRQLEDDGYGRGEIEESSDDEDHQSAVSKMAPWTLTRNFLDAVQGKCMLALTGDGDPTGCGEGFSFVKKSIRGSIKTGSKPDEPFPEQNSNSASQYAAYEAKIKQIWNAQKKSLSSTRNIIKAEAEEKQRALNKHRSLSDTSARLTSPFPTFGADGEETAFIGDSYTSAPTNKVLRIHRTYELPFGEIETRVETVYNSFVINAYLKQRQQVEDDLMLSEVFEPSNNEEKNLRVKKLIEDKLMILKKNFERRHQRKAMKAAGLLSKSAASQSGSLDDEQQKVGTRKCSSCGQVGHMKSSKLCVLNNEDSYLKVK